MRVERFVLGGLLRLQAGHPGIALRRFRRRATAQQRRAQQEWNYFHGSKYFQRNLIYSPANTTTASAAHTW